MIINEVSGVISPIALSVLLIIFLIILELGSEKTKKIFLPIIVALFVAFGAVFVTNILSKW
ncbi:hypothetical protein KAI32_03475 [Candidatus Pacearchaeota archaeon]|nr:hypothetical protein [Candidatus Pacearchaeota archaeon]